jgi:hypothetical protein
LDHSGGVPTTAAGVPLFSPPEMRHRRVSLLHPQGVPWPRTGEAAGHDADMSVATYTRVMIDDPRARRWRGAGPDQTDGRDPMRRCRY